MGKPMLRATDVVAAAMCLALAPAVSGEDAYMPVTDSVAIYRSSSVSFQLINHNVTAWTPDVLAYLGVPTDTPVVGDWEGDGFDTIGIYRGTERTPTFQLRSSNTTGTPDIVFAFGQAGDRPVVGDWDGDGVDTVGVWRGSNGTFYLRNSNTQGPPDITVAYGATGDIPIVGDWDGDGVTTIGVYRPTSGWFHLRNSNTAGSAEISVQHGQPGDQPLAGDWDGDGVDTIGVRHASTVTFSLRNSNTAGPGDVVFQFGMPDDVPLAGNWDGMWEKRLAASATVAALLPVTLDPRGAGRAAEAAGNRFGVVASSTVADAPCEMDLVSDLGVGWVRVSHYWDDMEPQRGQIDWYKADALVNGLVNRGLNIYWDFSYTPGWANGGHTHNYPPLDQADLYNHVFAVVSRYKDRIHYWGTWNEVNLKQFWNSHNVSQYANREMQTTINAIKAADPGAKVVVGELSSSRTNGDPIPMLKTLLDAAGGRAAVASFHLYDGGDSCSTRGQLIRQVRSKLNQWGYGNLPLWVTESRLSAPDQAKNAYITCIYDSVAPVTEKTFWYRLEGVDGRFGLTNSTPAASCRSTPNSTYWTFRDYIWRATTPCLQMGGDYCADPETVCASGYSDVGWASDCNTCCDLKVVPDTCDDVGGTCSSGGSCPSGSSPYPEQRDCAPHACCVPDDPPPGQTCSQLGGNLCYQTVGCALPWYINLGPSSDCVTCCWWAVQQLDCNGFGGTCGAAGSCPAGSVPFSEPLDCAPQPCCVPDEGDPCGGDPCCGDPCCGAHSGVELPPPCFTARPGVDPTSKKR